MPENPWRRIGFWGGRARRRNIRPNDMSIDYAVLMKRTALNVNENGAFVAVKYGRFRLVSVFRHSYPNTPGYYRILTDYSYTINWTNIWV